MNEEINKIVLEEVSKALSPEVLREKLAKNIQAAVSSGINDLFNYSGPVKTAIEGAIKENVCFDASKLTFANYNDIILNEVQTALSGMVDKQLKEKSEALVKELIETAPKEIKLSEIIELYKEYLIDKFSDELKEGDSPDEGEYYFEIEYEESEPEYGSFYDHKFFCEDLRKTGSLFSDGFEGLLKLHMYKSDKKEDLTYCYLNGSMAGKSSDLKDWDKFSNLEKMLYKIDQARTKIIMDSPDYEFTIEADYCEC